MAAWHVMGRRSLMGGAAAAAAMAGGRCDAAPGAAALTFLHFNDVYRHGPQGGFGGMAEMAAMLDAEAARAPGGVFRTFGGDVLSPSIASSATQGAHMIELLNAMRIEVAVLGNHEFDFGSGTARARIAESDFPWLGANVLGPDGLPFGGAAATWMREADGLKVGFVGVLTEATARLNPHAEGVSFASAEAALRAGADSLKRAGADIVVGLTHQDLADDERMARDIEGIDLILGGHDHEPTGMRDTGAPVLKAASDARYLAVAELRVDRPDRAAGKPARLRSVGWRLVPNVDIIPSAAVAAVAAGIDARLSGILSEPLARLETALDTRTGVVRSREAGMGNLVADALRAHFSADAALMNGGGLRGNAVYPAGSVITRRDLMAEMPFGNAVEKLEVSGAALLAALEHGVSGPAGKAGQFPQVSGIAFSYDPSAPAGARIGAAEVGGAPLDPARLYTLATTDYLASGGDGYASLKGAKVLVDASSGPLLVNVAAEAFAAKGTLSAVPEGRSRPSGRP